MKAFAKLFAKIDQTQSTNEKIACLEEYFQQASSSDSAWALFFLCGHRFKRLISSKKLLAWCIEKTNLPAWLVEECYATVGDTAETITLLLGEKEAEESDLSLTEWIEKHILPLKDCDEGEQKRRILEIWERTPTLQRFIINKILTGSFRVGVSHLLTIRALSKVIHVPSTVLSQHLMGNWEPTVSFFESLKEPLPSTITHLNPYPFYLASPLEDSLETLGEPENWLAEWKWDGIRSQGIHRRGKCALWSRGNELISHQFPEIIEALLSIPDGTVIDGEILAYRENAPLCFGDLQKRLGRKKPSKSIIEEIPIVLMVYDLLEFKDQDIRAYSLKKRRELLEEWIGDHPKILLSSPLAFENWQQIAEKRLQSKAMATEGLILKHFDSPYGTGRQRGYWWKYKIDPMTLDAVLMYAQAGKGRRANLYTDYTFGIWHENELIPIAKAYSGLSQEEIDELDAWIRRNTEEKFGPVRRVKLHHVFEIAFEGIQASTRHKSGVALRFPRILRWRKDKPVAECDTLDSIKKSFLHHERDH